MNIKEHDAVKLKDGRVAVIIDLTKPGVAYLAEMSVLKGDSLYVDFFIKHEDIAEVLPDDYCMPNPYVNKDWYEE